MFLLFVILSLAILFSFAKFSNYVLPEALRTDGWHASSTTGSALLVQHACSLFLINALTLTFNNLDITCEIYLQLLLPDRQHAWLSLHPHGGSFVRMLRPFPEQVQARNISITETMSLTLSEKFSTSEIGQLQRHHTYLWPILAENLKMEHGKMQTVHTDKST